ncbi:MAG: hypothetical protein ACP5N1_05810 [Candidatus Woesearchaeota archaeon]
MNQNIIKDKSQSIKEVVYTLGEDILKFLKEQNIKSEYNLAYSVMKEGKTSDRPYGIVDQYIYTIQLKTGFISRKKLIRIEAISSPNNSPSIMFGKEFKQHEQLQDEKYQKLIEIICGIAEKHNASPIGIEKHFTGYYILRTI